MTSTPPARLGRPPRLHREDLLAAATDLGLASFTMAQLAERLGVSEGALYRHFHGRDAIVSAACSRLFEQVDPALDHAATWQEYLEAVCGQVRTIALAHESFGPWLVAGSYDESSLRQFDAVLRGILHRAPELDADTAYLVGSQAVACTVGLVATGFVGAVPDEVSQDDLEDQFRWMLRSLLRGMTEHLAEDVPPPRRRALSPVRERDGG